MTTYLLEWPKSKTLNISKAAKDMELLLFNADGNAKYYNYLGRQFGNKQYHAPWLFIFTKKSQSLCPHKNLHMDVYSSFIYCCQNL